MFRATILTLAVVLTCSLTLSAEKLRVPSDDALKGSLDLIKEVYGEEHANAKTDEQLQVLARKLFSGASKTDDPIERFALLRVARDIAAQGCDGPTAFQIIDEMDMVYQVDAVVMKASVLYVLTKKARLPAERKSIAEQALALVDLAVARDDFGTATKLANMAMDEARRTRNAGLVKAVTARKKDLEELVKAHAEVMSVVDKLEEDPSDRNANLVVGKYRCFIRGDWDEGLRMLALGDDAALRAVAKQELVVPSSVADQAQLADAWWDLAEEATGTARTRMQSRAGFWYEKSLPGLSGLSKAKARRRLHGLGELAKTGGLTQAERGSSTSAPAGPAAAADILLTARAAKLHGSRIRLNKGGRDIGRWDRATDWASWDFQVSAPGTYRLELAYGCPLEQAGSTIAVQIVEPDGRVLASGRGTVFDTGGFYEYKTATLGTVRFAKSGPYTLAVKVVHKAHEAVMNLESIRLVRDD